MFMAKGTCLKGDKCVYSHGMIGGYPTQLNDAQAYVSSTALMYLPLDLGSVPCVFFHTSVCTDKACPYSHAPLTDASRQLLEEVSPLGVTRHHVCKSESKPWCINGITIHIE